MCIAKGKFVFYLSNSENDSLSETSSLFLKNNRYYISGIEKLFVYKPKDTIWVKNRDIFEEGLITFYQIEINGYADYMTDNKFAILKC